MRRSPSKRTYKKPLIIAIILLLVISGTVTALEATNTTYWFHKRPTATTGGASTKGISDDDSSGSSNGGSSEGGSPSTTPQATPSENGDTKSSGQGSPASQELLAPWGTFSNVYTASLSDQMGSTCNTTSGATCEIIFTNGSTSKSLKAQMTDKGGATYWSWTPRDVGLTPGKWHITAKAVLGDKSKTTSNDPLTLEITQ